MHQHGPLQEGATVGCVVIEGLLDEQLEGERRRVLRREGADADDADLPQRGLEGDGIVDAEVGGRLWRLWRLWRLYSFWTFEKLWNLSTR